MRSHDFYKHRKGGFTLSELLVVISIIMLLTSVVAASVTKARDRAMASRLSADFAETKQFVEMYLTQNATEPCHKHDMSDTSERNWSVGITKTWPTSPFKTKYFFTHNGNQTTPTTSDYYYIGVAMDPKFAQIFEELYDDNNTATGLFRYQANPLPHYSFFQSYVASGSHVHCP